MYENVIYNRHMFYRDKFYDYKKFCERISLAKSNCHPPPPPEYPFLRDRQKKHEMENERMLNINKTTENKTVCYELEGRLDTITAPELDEDIKASVEGMEELVIDLKQLDYISSAGLRVLLAAYKTMSVQGGMKVINVNEMIMDIFDTTGFSDILTIE